MGALQHHDGILDVLESFLADHAFLTPLWGFPIDGTRQGFQLILPTNEHRVIAHKQDNVTHISGMRLRRSNPSFLLIKLGGTRRDDVFTLLESLHPLSLSGLGILERKCSLPFDGCSILIDQGIADLLQRHEEDETGVEAPRKRLFLTFESSDKIELIFLNLFQSLLFRLGEVTFLHSISGLIGKFR